MTTLQVPSLPQLEAAPRRRHLSFVNLLVLVLILSSGVIFAVALARQSAGQPTSGTAPDFSLTTFTGETLRLSDLRGRVVVLNFWASWCGPCEQEAPELRAAAEHYAGREDVVFLGVAYADSEVRAQAFAEEHGLNYRNGADIGTRISDLYAIRGVPETFIIGQDGKIAEFIYAGITAAQLQHIIDPLLGEG
jgi:cytochrome c biogenesis protein CcmG/thiol:disulfide interchange protein DsbE